MDKKLFFALMSILFLSVSCSLADPSSTKQTWFQPSGKIKILSTTAMIDDIVKQIGKEFVDTNVLIKGELDPHSYQLVKGDDEKLAFADLVFFNGLGLEHGPSLQSYLTQHDKAIALGNHVMSGHPGLLLYYKGQPDPHIWMDISLWAKTVPYIVEVLGKKDPIHAEVYHKNGKDLIAEMMQTHQVIRQQMQSIPDTKRYLVTSHDAFNYFTRAYLAADGEDYQAWHHRFAAPEGLAPESQISTTDIQEIIDHLMRHNIHVIFPESNVNRDSIRKIVQAAQKKGLNVIMAEGYLYADAMGKPGSEGDTYLKMLKHNAKIIADQLINNGG